MNLPRIATSLRLLLSWSKTKQTTMMKSFLLVSLLALLISPAVSRRDYGGAGILEKEILEEYEKRGHTWPPKQYLPNTPGWKAVMERRFAQIRQIESNNIKHIGWLETLRAGVTFDNFTEYGWGLTRVQDDLLQALVQGVEDGLPTAELEWASNPNSVLLIHRPDLITRLQEEMKSVMEAWTGLKLLPTDAIGFRIYRNNATSLMHAEYPNTRALGCIVQIASSPQNAEPWPIAVEDYEGNLNLVHLTAGDALLWESSKLYHGRPLPFIGNWTTAVVAFYVPLDEKFEYTNHEMEATYALPPIWREVPEKEDDFPELGFVGMTFTEPSCHHNWCALKDAIAWQGPAELDHVLTTGNKKDALSKIEHDEL